MTAIPVSADRMAVQSIESTAELEALRPEWTRLWERCPSATPFQSPEWLLPWWKHLGHGRLWALAVRESGRLVGLAPLMLLHYFRLPFRRVLFVGTGKTDYLDFLLDPEWAPAALDRILGHLDANRRRWDFLDFHQLTRSSALLHARLPKGWASRRIAQAVCPYLPLPARLSSGLRQNVRRYRRRLESAGTAAFELADETTLPEMMSALFRLHQERWNRRLMPGAYGTRSAQAFHREVAAGMLRRGMLRLYGLRLDGVLGAALYCFHHGRRDYFYGGGFAAEWSRYSPGTLLVNEAIEGAVRSGCDEFDFLRGDEPYKDLWGVQRRENERLVCWRRSSLGALAPRLVEFELRTDDRLHQIGARLAGSRH